MFTTHIIKNIQGTHPEARRKAKRIRSALDYINVYQLNGQIERERIYRAYAVLVEYGEDYLNVPVTFRNEDVAIWGVRQKGYYLRETPVEAKTYDVCLAAVRTEGQMLQEVPKTLRDLPMCWAAIENDGWALNFTPEHLKTETLCKVAVDNCAAALKAVPTNLRTGELCLGAVQRDPNQMVCVFGKEKRAFVLRHLTERQRQSVQFIQNRIGHNNPKPKMGQR